MKTLIIAIILAISVTALAQQPPQLIMYPLTDEQLVYDFKLINPESGVEAVGGLRIYVSNKEKAHIDIVTIRKNKDYVNFALYFKGSKLLKMMRQDIIPGEYKEYLREDC